jgi:acyl dehydratase
VLRRGLGNLALAARCQAAMAGVADRRVSRLMHRDQGMQVMMKSEFFELVGQELGKSDWFLIDQHRIDQFAEVTEDRQFIHVDPVRAADSPFGGTIAHGMLTLSMIVHLCEKFAQNIEGQRMVINYGFDKIRFATPVKVGKRIRAVAKLMDVRERAGQLIVKTKVTIEIEGETKPALVAEWLTMHVFGSM